MFFKPKQKVDPLFGLMKFRRSFGFFGAGFWEGAVKFAPLEKRVNIYVTAGRSGISETQRDFYRQIEQRYAEINDRTLEILYDTFHNYMPLYFSEYTRKETLEDCELDGIGIPDFRKKDAEWLLSFMYMPHKQTYSVYFDGWRPIYGKLDD